MSVGMILGGALQGIGAGMGQKAQMDYEARRQAALENLRSQNNRVEIAQRGAEDRRTVNERADLDDRNSARQVSRQTNSQIVVDKAKTQNDIQLEGVKFSNDREMARFKSALDRSNDAARQTLGAAIDAGKVKEVIKGGDGQYWAVYADGQRQPTGVVVPPESDSFLTGAPKAAAPAPSPTAAGQKPAGKPSLPKGWTIKED